MNMHDMKNIVQIFPNKTYVWMKYMENKVLQLLLNKFPLASNEMLLSPPKNVGKKDMSNEMHRSRTIYLYIIHTQFVY